MGGKTNVLGVVTNTDIYMQHWKESRDRDKRFRLTIDLEFVCSDPWYCEMLQFVVCSYVCAVRLVMHGFETSSNTAVCIVRWQCAMEVNIIQCGGVISGYFNTTLYAVATMYAYMIRKRKWDYPYSCSTPVPQYAYWGMHTHDICIPADCDRVSSMSTARY